MNTIVHSLLSLLTAGVVAVSVPLENVTPQNDINSGIFLVNREWRISKDYVPIVVQADVKGQVRNLQADAARALKEMFDACHRDLPQVTLVSVSGYRSYGKQASIYQRKLSNTNGNRAKADKYVARAGASEHQLALAMDVGQYRSKTGLNNSFANTEGGKWLKDHCWEYGFILRYDEDWESITGYGYEPWHFRYVGREYASEIHSHNEPLESYLIKLRISRVTDALSMKQK